MHVYPTTWLIPFPTAGTRPRELKQRLQQLNIFDGIERDQTVLVQIRQRQEVVPVNTFAIT
jgi:hypothetical protein